MAEAVIVSSVRTPVGRGYKGSLRTSRPDHLAAQTIKEALARVPGLDQKKLTMSSSDAPCPKANRA